MTEQRASDRSAEPRRLAALAQDFLHVAARLTASIDNAGLASALYHANSVALTPSWLAEMPGCSAVERHLFREDDEVKTKLARCWRARPDENWLHFETRRRRSPPGFKLYVSSVPQDAGAALRAAVSVMVEHGAPQFKVARQPRLMLRPDRMVIYLDSREELDRLARALIAPLGRFAAQGVPFSCSLDDAGILSWGRDPPPSVRHYGASWRSWVTRKLAAYLNASDAADAEGRVAFVHERMIDEGVDPISWEPQPGLWEGRDGH